MSDCKKYERWLELEVVEEVGREQSKENVEIKGNIYNTK